MANDKTVTAIDNYDKEFLAEIIQENFEGFSDYYLAIKEDGSFVVLIKANGIYYESMMNRDVAR